MARKSFRSGRRNGGRTGVRRTRSFGRRARVSARGVSSRRGGQQHTVRIVLEQPGFNQNTASPMLHPGLKVDNTPPGKARF